MLASVGFDDQHALEAGEIGDVWSDWTLTTEFVPAQAAVPQE
jgi:hypothetical protein